MTINNDLGDGLGAYQPRRLESANSEYGPKQPQAPKPDYPPGKSPDDAPRTVLGASHCLIGFWIFYILLCVGFILVGINEVNQAAGPIEQEGGIRKIVIFGFILVYCALGLHGALAFIRLRSYGWGMASAIMMLITGPGLIIPLIFGIYAIVIINQPHVRQAIRIIQNFRPPRRQPYHYLKNPPQPTLPPEDNRSEEVRE